ncbi:MAG: 3-phosphoserine/phosphohydroxythreonine transaminase [Gammaproteobacteria bacterium]
MRTFNFAAGPAMLPPEVVQRVRAELPDGQRGGMSVLELPFTGRGFREIAAAAQRDLGELLGVPPHYRILFMHGGASAQFAAVPLNLAGPLDKADYIETGHWARKAVREAGRYCDARVAASGAAEGFTRVPMQDEWRLSADAAYCHITTNETANGLEYHWTPDTGGVPLVADMSSNFLAGPIDVSRYGLIYAAAQKNIGTAGLAIVIVRADLLDRRQCAAPSVLNYSVQAASDSMYNTPPIFAVYVAGLVFDWLKRQGGLTAMARINRRKSARLYDAIDRSGGFYRCPVARADRSRVNVCFTVAEGRLEAEFLRQAEEEGLLNLKGHSAVGGIRASLYNAMPEEGVAALADFMQHFAARYG